MKKISKIILVCMTLLLTVFVISACGKKEPTATSTSNTKEEASTDESGAVIFGSSPFRVPKVTKIILTVNGEDVYPIEDEKEIENIINIMLDKEENIVTEGKVESANWMYELYFDNKIAPKVYFTEDGKYESWHGPGGWDGNTYGNASTGIVEHLKSVIHAQKKKNEIQWGKISKIILVCIIVLIAVFAILAHRKKKLQVLKKNTEEEVSTDGK